MANHSTGPLIEMFTGPGCAYCARAREVLEARGLAYIELDTANRIHLEDFTRRLPRSRSLPQIFIEGEHIGSFEDLQEWDATGRLAAGSAD